MKAQKQESVRFGAFQFHFLSLELRKGNEVVHLQEKPAQVLRLLLLTPGDLVTRPAIQEELWPDSPAGEMDVHLNVAISKLREALGDSSKAPAYIQTVPGRGYRFVCKTGNGLPRNSSRYIYVLVSVLIPALLLALYVSYVNLKDSFLQPVAVKTRHVTVSEATEYDADLSPDGSRVVYASSGESTLQSALTVVDLSTGEKTDLTRPGYLEHSPVWSPDGESIAFLRASRQSCGINLISLSDLEVTELHPLLDCEIRSPPWNLDSLSWSPDGEAVAFSDTSASGKERALFLLYLSDGRVEEISSPVRGSDGDYFPRFSPDGKAIAFLRGSDHGFEEDLYVLNLESGSTVRLTSDNVTIVGYDWDSRTGDLIFSSRRASDLPSLWKVSLDGRLESVSGIDSGAILPSVSHVGGHLSYTRWSNDYDIWRVAVSAGSATAAPQKVISSTLHDSAPAELSGPETLVFTSDRTGRTHLWTVNDKTGLPIQLTDESYSPAASPRPSPDGRLVAFDSRRDGNPDIYLLQVSDGSIRRLTRDPAADVLPSWSRDGQWIYFSSDRSGRMRIWKVALEGGKPIPVSLEDGFCCEESRDGSKILYTRSGPRRICQVDKESPLKETVLLEGIRWGRWTVATEGLYFLEINNSLGNRIKFYEFSSGKTSTVLDLPQAITHFPGNRSLFISADEKRLYFSGGHQDVDIVLVEGF